MIARWSACGAARLALAALAVALTMYAGSPAAHGAAKKRWSDYDRPATYQVASDDNIALEMRDGVTLRADVRRPDAPGRFPVLVVQTPYNKDTIGAFLGGGTDYFVERGYAVATVDVRGTGSSEGTWDSFGEAEQRDSAEIVEWAASQPWSSGRVGLYGPSYMGLNQLLTAAQRPPGLEAIFPIVPLADGYRDIVFSGGQINLSFIPLWLGLVTVGGLTPVTSAPNGVDDVLSSVTALLNHVGGVLSFQLPVLVEGLTGADIAFDGPFWKTRSPLEVVDEIRVPAFVVGGHHDLFQRGEPLIYERLKQNVPARLLMGPWTHLEGSTGAGLPRDGVPALNQIALRWFDRWLLDEPTRVGQIPRVTQYVYGRERYATQRDWPDPRLKLVRRYLRGDGGLAPRPPAEAEAPQSFLQNPLDGICTQSTSQWTAGLGGLLPCTTDGRADEALGAATYTTPPLSRPLQLSGPILARLWVTTTAADAVLTVRVKDVAPDGEVTELTAGWLAGSFRAVDRSRSRFVKPPRGTPKPRHRRLLQPWHPFTRESVLPVNPGEPMPLAVEIFPTRAALKPGHRLRITVSGGDFPHQLPPLPQLVGSLAGTVRVLTDPDHRSYVALPGLRRHCHGRCSRLPVPDLVRGR